MTSYEIWYTDDAGNKIDYIDNMVALEYTLVSGDVGRMRLSLPFDDSRLYNAPFPDRQCHIYRCSDIGAELEDVFFCRNWDKDVDDSGREITVITGVTANHLLWRRIVGYAAGTSQADKTDLADDFMKEVVTENLGTSATAVRQFNISIQGDLGAAPSLSKAFAWEKVLSVARALQAQSRAAGTEVFFRLYANTPTTFIFETMTGQPGQDRTVTGNNPLLFGVKFGNVAGSRYSEEYIDEVNYVYAGGRGQGSDRNIQERSDDDRINISQWNRIEAFAPATNATTDAGVQAVGDNRLVRGRPVRRYAPTLLSTESTPYGGSGWRLGDRSTINHIGNLQFDVIIRAVNVRVDGRGQEKITGYCEYVG